MRAITMLFTRTPRQRFAKSYGRAARRRQLTAILDATWEQDLEVMLYLVDR